MPAFSHRVVLGTLLLSCFVALPALGQRQEAANGYRLAMATDHENAVYKAGQPAKFEITVWNGDQRIESKGVVSYLVDDFRSSGKISSGKQAPASQPLIVEGTLEHPGFLRCQVTYQPPKGKAIRATAAAAFSPELIKPSLPVPDDFDKFWAEQKQRLAEVPMDAKLTPVAYPDKTVECFNVEVGCLGGAPVSGYLSVPKQAKPKSLPAILWVHGAGVRSSSIANAIKGARAGMLSLDINAHGIPNGKPGEFYKKLNAGQLKGYRYAGRESRESIYFRGMFLRLVRAIDYLTSRPEWNGEHVVVIGHSQGGGQALAAGGLDERVTLVASGVPAICDHSGSKAQRVNGWPKLVPDGPNGTPDEKILEAARYVDAVNFASRCKAEAIMSVGFIDAVCPPSSCYAAFNALSGSKQIINEPQMGHAAPPHIHAAFFRRVQDHVGKSPQN